MNRRLVEWIRHRAANRCEYCRLHQSALRLPFQVDHICAEQHGGQTIEGNLALACAHCNRYKGPNIAGFDVDTGQLSPLFNPRKDIWAEHFGEDGVYIRGITATGRVTVSVLKMNSSDRLRIRGAIIDEES